MTPRALMTTSAAVLAAAGLALLFAPAEIQRLAAGAGPAPVPAPVPALVLQLWSAALLGLAVTDWTGRGLTLGGIYGRALVLGNAMHWTVSALVGVRAAIDHPARAAHWAVAVVCGAFAVAFHVLLRRHPGAGAAGG